MSRKANLQGELRQFTCLLGAMVQEAYDAHPAIRRVCDRCISEHAARLEADLAEAKALALRGREPREPRVVFPGRAAGRLRPRQGQIRPKSRR
jgi:hypothetical protein